jgi:hypothetical protein
MPPVRFFGLARSPERENSTQPTIGSTQVVIVEAENCTLSSICGGWAGESPSTQNGPARQAGGDP